MEVFKSCVMKPYSSYIGYMSFEQSHSLNFHILVSVPEIYEMENTLTEYCLWDFRISRIDWFDK